MESIVEPWYNPRSLANFTLYTSVTFGFAVLAISKIKYEFVSQDVLLLVPTLFYYIYFTEINLKWALSWLNSVWIRELLLLTRQLKFQGATKVNLKHTLNLCTPIPLLKTYSQLSSRFLLDTAIFPLS